MPSRREPFRPRFTLMLLYVAAFFLLYALLFVAPDLAPLLGAEGQALPPEELQARAQQVSQHAMRGKVPIALGASLVTVGLGAWRRVLPGMR
jgi:heme A synthase